MGDDAQPASRANKVALKVDLVVDLMGIACLVMPRSITLKTAKTKEKKDSFL